MSSEMEMMTKKSTEHERLMDASMNGRIERGMDNAIHDRGTDGSVKKR